MAYMIDPEECIVCAACEEECPNEAISEGDEVYVIDPNKCTECIGWFEESQCALVCPVDACVPDPDHEESQEESLAKFKKLHPDKEPKVFYRSSRELYAMLLLRQSSVKSPGEESCASEPSPRLFCAEAGVWTA